MPEPQIKKPLSILNVIVTSVTGIFVIWSAVQIYMTNIWHPKVEINSIDWERGIADLEVNGKQRTLFGDTELAGGWGWGFRFAKPPDDKSPGYDRIELVRGNQIYHIIEKKDLANVTEGQ